MNDAAMAADTAPTPPNHQTFSGPAPDRQSTNSRGTTRTAPSAAIKMVKFKTTFRSQIAAIVQVSTLSKPVFGVR